MTSTVLDVCQPTPMLEEDYLSWITRDQQDRLIKEMINDGVLREDGRRLMKNGVFNEEMRLSIFGAMPRGANIYDLYNTRERELNNWDDSWKNETGIRAPQWFQENFPQITTEPPGSRLMRGVIFNETHKYVQTSGDAEHLFQFEPELKNLAEMISSKNAALNASLRLLNFIREHVDLTNLNQNAEYLQLNKDFSEAIKKIH